MPCKFCILHFIVWCWLYLNNMWRITIFSEFQTSKILNETLFLPPLSWDEKPLIFSSVTYSLFFPRDSSCMIRNPKIYQIPLGIRRPQSDSSSENLAALNLIPSWWSDCLEGYFAIYHFLLDGFVPEALRQESNEQHFNLTYEKENNTSIYFHGHKTFITNICIIS